MKGPRGRTLRIPAHDQPVAIPLFPCMLGCSPFPARVIQEELLKDLGNRSELSDWFGREDAPVVKRPVPERPNPKNIQNKEKIAEVEEQIRR